MLVLDERTFLHWEEINYFVPTKSDPNVLPLNADRKQVENFNSTEKSINTINLHLSGYTTPARFKEEYKELWQKHKLFSKSYKALKMSYTVKTAFSRIKTSNIYTENNPS